MTDEPHNSGTTARPDGTQPRIGRTIDESIEGPIAPAERQPSDAPNVLLIVLDDVGFAHCSGFGSSIETPNIDRLAAEGLAYTNFHTTPLCSPTRAALLTGRNSHSVGFGHVTERIAGYPGYRMRLPDDAATVAQILSDAGYSTRAVGKWHLTPSFEIGPAGPFDRWPTGRGFERFYGFLGGCADQFAPELHRDNSPVQLEPSAGYHLSTDLVDESIGQVRELQSMGPDHPFFLYLAFGACHSPHQAPKEWIEKYRGAFDHGWDEERRRVLERQVQRGVVREGTELGASNPGVQEWNSLAADEQRLYARMMEVYAGFLSHTDAQIGRLLDDLADSGTLDNTLVMLMSDNGASAEGGPGGIVDDSFDDAYGPRPAAEMVEHIDELGGPGLYNHYPWGWAQAGNTPFRWYKQFTHAGGIANGLLVRWPHGGVPAGQFRRQYHHVIDVAPTILDATGVSAPSQVRGVTQRPMHGVSMRYSWSDEHAEGARHTQYYEMWGNRGLWHDGWMAVCRLQPDAAGARPPAQVPPFDELTWELYDHTTDPSECHDLARAHPEKLRELEDLWWAAAGRYDVLPIDTRQRGQRWPADPPRPPGSRRDRAVFHGPGGPFERGVAPRVQGRSFTMAADVHTDGSVVEGVLYALGGVHGGYCWYLQDGRMCFESAPSSLTTETVSADVELERGEHRLGLRVEAYDDLSGEVLLSVDGQPVGGGRVTGLLRKVLVGAGRSWVGSAPRGTVAHPFPPPFLFTGRLNRLAIECDGHAVPPSPEKEHAAQMREQ